MAISKQLMCLKVRYLEHETHEVTREIGGRKATAAQHCSEILKAVKHDPC